ncbi:MAG: hypothetical protein E7165_04240 [Firmicutes bacterium]|nr:hypothetical protein [Bacillota bacterium]
MAKRFKGKNRKRKIFKFIVFIGVIYLIYSFFSLMFLNIKLVDNNEDFIKNLLSDSNYHMLYEKRGKNVVYKVANLLTGLNIKEPITILENSFGYQNKNEESGELVYNDMYENNSSIQQVIGELNKDNQNLEPLVYIYNSHQTEGYSKEFLETYNITPNVLMAGYLLKEKLDKIGIPTIIEESNITEFLRINNWSYKDSYKASRFYLLDAINKYPSIKLFVDLHRDSLSKENSTVTINNKKYAKIMFVVGKEHENYQENLALANKLNQMIKAKCPTLSRGVLQKEGAGVNGIYNQDISKNVVLLELGGNENTITEVLNTIEIISTIIKEHINETGI